MRNYQVGHFRDAYLGQCQISQICNWLHYQDTDKKVIIIISLENSGGHGPHGTTKQKRKNTKKEDKSPVGMW